MAAVIERNVINGMDVGALHETMEAIRDRPQLAQFHFRVHNRWFSGHHSRSVVDNFHGVGHETTTRDLPFQVEIDEPPELLGGNAAPNPVEYVLSALAGCLTSALVMSASAKGVRLDAVESSLEGDVDVRGLLGMDDQIPAWLPGDPGHLPDYFRCPARDAGGVRATGAGALAGVRYRHQPGAGLRAPGVSASSQGVGGSRHSRRCGMRFRVTSWSDPTG